jgi:hypothetical protein
MPLYITIRDHQAQPPSKTSVDPTQYHTAHDSTRPTTAQQGHKKQVCIVN